MPTIGAKRHAEKVAAWGVDAVIAQGHEGGGHTGNVSTTLLLPQVCDTVDIPVLGAGGFCDGRGLVAALAYGASGIAMGTRFLLTKESTVPNDIKQIYLDTAASGTVVYRNQVGGGEVAYTVAFHPTEPLLAWGAYDGKVRLVDLARGTEIRSFQANKGGVEPAHHTRSARVGWSQHTTPDQQRWGAYTLL